MRYLFLFSMFSLFGFNKAPAQEVPASIYEFKMLSLDGEVIDFSQYKGKKLLIVNTASKCGYTPQYAELQTLSETYKNELVVLGFPANNFMWQEPGSNEEIAEFCQKNYGVTFQMFEKISVKGKDKSPLYQWLENQSGELPSWNFCKYLIDENGKFVAFYSQKVNPLDESIVSKIR